MTEWGLSCQVVTKVLGGKIKVYWGTCMMGEGSVLDEMIRKGFSAELTFEQRPD